MGYTDLIFDLYGTLVDIHTEENDLVWEKTALYFSFHGARYSGSELEADFRAALSRREVQAGQSYECFPDIPVELVFGELFRKKGIAGNAEELAFSAAQLFRICSIDYVKLYPHVREALATLRERGCRLWLLSNAQRAFTAYELRALGLDGDFDGIYISSDYRCRKPDLRFYRALVEERGLNVQTCLMIGNDRNTDIAGARAMGMDTLYMHTALTPPDQAPADPENAPEGQYEFEGDDWQELCGVLCELIGGRL